MHTPMFQCANLLEIVFLLVFTPMNLQILVGHQINQPVLKQQTLMEYFIENGYQTLGTGKLTHGKPSEYWQQWGNNTKHNYGPFYYDGEKVGVLPNVPDPYRQIGTIDGSYGRISDGGISNGKYGNKGLVYGWDLKPFRYTVTKIETLQVKTC